MNLEERKTTNGEDVRGEYIAVQACVGGGGRIVVTYHKSIEGGTSVLKMSFPPGAVIRIGEKVVLENLGFLPSSFETER